MTAIPDFSIRMQVAGMRGLLSEIIAVGALSKHGDTDLMERVREAADTPLPELPTRGCLAQIEEPAAPAAVAGPDWDKTRDFLAALLLGLARRPFLDFDVACIALDAATEPGMPLAYMRGTTAAPALEAPAAPSEADIAAAREHIADVHNATQMRSALSQLRPEVVVELVARGLLPSIYAPMAAAPQAPAALDELRQIAAIAACWGCDHPDEPGDTELLRRVKWAARQLRAVAQAPTAPAEAQRLAQFLQDRRTHLGSCRESAGTYNQQAWDDYERAWTMLLGMVAPAAPSAIATQVIENLLQLARIVNTAVEDWGETKEDDSMEVIFHKEEADKMEAILEFFDGLPDAPAEEGVIESGPLRAARVLRAQAAPAAPVANPAATWTSTDDGLPEHGDLVLCDFGLGHHGGGIRFGYEVLKWDEHHVVANVSRWLKLDRLLAAPAAPALSMAPFSAPPRAITASMMRDDGGEAPAFCVMAAYRSESDARDALSLLSAAPAAPAVDASDDKALLDFLRDTSCDLRSIDVPTGGDDSDVHWRVIAHYMSEPREREIGRSWSDDPREAIRAAIAAQAAAKGENGNG